MLIIVLKLAQSKILRHRIGNLAKHGEFINKRCAKLLELEVLNFKLIALFHRQFIIGALVLQIEFGYIRWISYSNLVSEAIEFKTVEGRQVLA